VSTILPLDIAAIRETLIFYVVYFNVTYGIKYNTFLVSFQAFMIWLITWITKYTTPSRTAAMHNGKIVDTCAKLPQTHMYMESD
jgi:hypothetical protein